MARPEDYIWQASQYIGVSGTDNIFNTWYWGQPCYDPYTYPWCAAFQSYVGVHDLGMPFNPSASASGVAWQGTQVDYSEVQPGDWVLFDWDGVGDFGYADHIGLVEWANNDSGWFGTIEGNTGGGEGTVMRCTRSIYNGYSTAFFRPPYSGDAPEPEPSRKPEQDPGEPINDAGLWYRAHVAETGWLDSVHDGQKAGTVGFGAQLEALKIAPPEGFVLEVRAHIAGIGWRTYKGIKAGERSGEGSSKSDPIIGTVGEGRAIEDISIRVTERPKNDKRRLKFRVHQAEKGWKAWTGEGNASGSDGLGIPLEAIQMVLK